MFRRLLMMATVCLCAGSCATWQRDKNYDWNADLQNRISADFPKSETQITDYIRRYIPDVTPAQIAGWEKSGALEFKVIDGQKRYFVNADANLFRVDPRCKAVKDSIDAATHKPFLDGQEKIDSVSLPAIISCVKQSGNKYALQKKFKIRYTLTVDADAVPEGEIVRCWLPFPRKDVQRQTDVRFIASSEQKIKFAPEGSTHSTLYMEKKAVKGKPTVFWEDFEYASRGEWNNLSADKVLPYNPGGPGISVKDYVKYTGEREAHVVFTPRLRAIADSLTAGITNPYLQAKAMFTWINDNFPWASAREYSTIPDIPEYVLDSGHGDCGQVSLLLITLCRYKGIPAHFQSGFMMHPGGNWNLHDWAEVYFEGPGWVPVDQSFGIPRYAAKGSEEEYFFLGGIEPYRMIVNNDFGDRLYPKKIYPRSETVDFQRGEVEWKGGNLYFPQWNYSMSIDYL